ncbi:MAG: peptidase M61 [Roseivirga sp.]|nr:peptidase M61 [Roseivirga sp.]
MNKIKLVLSGMIISTMLLATDPYKYTVDITNVSEDKVYVELDPPKIRKKEIVFYLPKIVPGTYAIADYGRMVSDLKAYDKKGREMEIERLDDNSWKIKNAKKLAKIGYWVEDTFDTEKDGPNIFQPAGTNIEEGKNFVINTSGFFGYFEGMKKKEFELNFVRPKGFYGATGMQPLSEGGMLSGKISLEATKPSADNSAVDRFSAGDYDKLVDAPLMYSKADTAIVRVGNTDVLVASYSPNNVVTAKEIAGTMKEVLEAQFKYLGGKLPVDKYAFIFYFTDKPVTSYGALEHSYSSLYYMPEAPIAQMNQQLRNFAAHEFFHIVTPLNVHSEEIDNFDFNEPKMSQHLWMYEGMTEYFAGNVQVKHGLITPDQYLNVLRGKILQANQYNDTLPFTVMSKGTLDEHAGQYGNVYQKGALIGMALDIKLRKLSDGAYGTQNLMAQLSERFGKNAAFQDDELFGVITEMTYPEIGKFFAKHVAGNEPLPYAELFKEVGVNFEESGMIKTYSLGIGQTNITIAQHEGKQMLAIANAQSLDEMGKALGLQNGDILYKMNGKEIPDLSAIQGFIGEQMQNLPNLENFTYVVLREVDGAKREIELSAENKQIEVPAPFNISFDPEATDAQLALRKVWLEPSN